MDSGRLEELTPRMSAAGKLFNSIKDTFLVNKQILKKWTLKYIKHKHQNLWDALKIKSTKSRQWKCGT